MNAARTLRVRTSKMLVAPVMTSDAINTFLSERIEAGDFPSAVYLAAEKGEIVLHDALGLAVVVPERIQARLGTIYDLASLTKVLVTGPLMAMFVERGKIALDDAVSGHLSEFDTDEKRCITVRQLLTHTSGLPAWRPLYRIAKGKTDVLRTIADTALEYASGGRVVYSDLNFLTLQALIESVEDQPLDEIAERDIFTPLGLVDTGFGPVADRHRVAASETGNAFERETCIEKGHSVGSEADLRDRAAAASGSEAVIWGDVHDGNAFFLGGVAGHAGLFSTAAEVLRIAQQFLPNYSQLFEPATCELFRTNFTPGMNEHRSFAFQLASTPKSAAGLQISPQSFGHLGFTGTSMWIDPVKERVYILLTNRTHNHSLPFVNLNSVRRRFHDLANETLDQK